MNIKLGSKYIRTNLDLFLAAKDAPLSEYFQLYIKSGILYNSDLAIPDAIEDNHLKIIFERGCWISNGQYNNIVSRIAIG